MDNSREIPLKNKCLTEFFGTALFLFIGMACVAALKLTQQQYSTWEINIIWGLAVSLGIYLTANISGGHLNPALTLALWLYSGFNRRHVIPYILSQIAGAFCAAALIYGLFGELITYTEQASNLIRNSEAGLSLAGIFSTFPNPHISVFQGFFIEMIITALLICVVLFLLDEKNSGSLKALAPFLTGCMIAILGASFAPFTGAAMNPARDFGPRLFSFFAGWGDTAMTAGRSIPYFLVPLIAPMLGGCIGGYCYHMMVGRYRK